MSGESAAVVLPPVLTLGFAGGCAAVAEPVCMAAITRALRVEQSGFAGVVCGVAGLNGQGDLLFAEACLECGLPLRVLLPMPQAELASMWEPAAWGRVQTVLAQAVSVGDVGSDEATQERLYECALAVAQRSHTLLALWDGVEAGEERLSGAAPVVAFARSSGRLVIDLDCVSGAVREHPAEPKKSLGDLAFLNELPTCGAQAVDASERALAEAWLDKLDRNAMLVAPQVRRLAAVPITLTALAAFVAAAAEHVQPHALWVGAGAVLGLAAALLPGVLRLGTRQARWVRLRTAAELTRAVLAVWETPVPYRVVGPEILPELTGMLDALNLLKARAWKGAEMPLGEFRAAYLENRVRDQRRYFTRQAGKAAAQGMQFRRAARVATIVAIALSAWAFGRQLFVHAGTAKDGSAWLPLLTSALFQVATVAGALVVVHDCDRRRSRYHELDRSLGRWEVELDAFHTWHLVLEVVDNVERALLVELLEWRSLLMNRKMPRS